MTTNILPVNKIVEFLGKIYNRGITERSEWELYSQENSLHLRVRELSLSSNQLLYDDMGAKIFKNEYFATHFRSIVELALAKKNLEFLRRIKLEDIKSSNNREWFMKKTFGLIYNNQDDFFSQMGRESKTWSKILMDCNAEAIDTAFNDEFPLEFSDVIKASSLPGLENRRGRKKTM